MKDLTQSLIVWPFYLVDMIACTTTTPMNINRAQRRPSLKEGSGLCWYSPSCCLLKRIKIGLKSSLGFFIDLKELQEKCKLLLHKLNSFAKYEYLYCEWPKSQIFAGVSDPRYIQSASQTILNNRALSIQHRKNISVKHKYFVMLSFDTYYFFTRSLDFFANSALTSIFSC